MAVLGRGQPIQPTTSQTLGAGGGRFGHPAFVVNPARTPPTVPATADLAGGTGTRSFGSVTTAAGDYLVCEITLADQSNTAVPTCTGLTFTARNDTGAVASHGRVYQFTAPDAAGAARVVTVTPSGSIPYRARLSVVRGSDGPAGVGNTATAQTVTVARQNDSSIVLMAVVDWTAGALGTPAWRPGGATVASELQAGQATYIFGRWDDTGASVVDPTHGITSPAYTTPSIAALEMLGQLTPVAAVAGWTPAVISPLSGIF